MRAEQDAVCAGAAAGAQQRSSVRVWWYCTVVRSRLPHSFDRREQSVEAAEVRCWRLRGSAAQTVPASSTQLAHCHCSPPHHLTYIPHTHSLPTRLHRGVVVYSCNICGGKHCGTAEHGAHDAVDWFALSPQPRRCAARDILHRSPCTTCLSHRAERRWAPWFVDISGRFLPNVVAVKCSRRISHFVSASLRPLLHVRLPS